MNTILIVEDELINYLFLSTLLEDEIDIDCTTLHAKNGENAVEICKNNKNIDLVLMDMKLPGITGLEATKIIKEFRPDLPIIAQSAYNLKESFDESLPGGFDDYITKPIYEHVLQECIIKYLKIK